MSERYDVAVIGAGIVGVATALHLRVRGKTVLLIDRRGPGLETSFGNAGILQTYDTLPFGVPPLSRLPGILLNKDPAVRLHYRSSWRHIPWILEFFWRSRRSARKASGRMMRPLNAAGLDEHRVLMRGTDAARYLSPHGRIALYRSQASFEGSLWELEIAKEMGVSFDIADRGAMADIEPHLKPGFYKAVRWVTSARLTNPGAVTSAYAERFVREGGAFRQAEVRALSQQGGIAWVIDAGTVSLSASEVVICAGPWAQDILRPLGYHFPLGTKRGYHRHFGMSGGASFVHAFTDMDVGYVMAPMEQGYRLVTGAEIAEVSDPPDPVQLNLILPYAKQLFPLAEPVSGAPWCGNRSCFSDSRPVIGRAPRHPGLWLNIGHAHSGITAGPASARLLAEMMTGETPFCDTAPFRAERFNC
ncbi:MAG: FAD-binding oxidoreductase [Pseudomonadota bacterium]|nr:FAD-binding oxidoreductase [Pseudomonadota bacterium]